MPLAPGTRLGPYEILAPLGAGGMGEVYRARDTRLAREVAVKILPGDFLEGKERKGRFEREAKLLASLNHPNIAAVFSFEEISISPSSSPVPVLVMELVEGQTLRKVLAGGALPLRKLLSTAAQIADGLAKAHGNGIVHRDLKPENVMVTKDGGVKILDFGLAKLVERPEEELTHSPTLSAATSAGVVLGTVPYLSPEQARGEPVDFRSDQFALGSMLYEMATGRRAFARASAPETMTAIIRDEPESLASAAPSAPAPFRWVVERCLAKDKDERYASTRDLARDLARLRADASGALASSAARPAVSRRDLARWALPVLAAAVAVGAVAALGARRRAAGPPVWRPLTFRRGSIGGARFAPDGRTVVYAAAWRGEPPRLFTTRLDSTESSALALPSANLASLSPKGMLAIVLPRPGGNILAEASLAGGAPRELVDGLPYNLSLTPDAADWAPAGDGLAVVRKRQLEFPPGKVLVPRGPGNDVFAVRFSPDGQRIAFVRGTAGRNDVGVVDRSGRTTTLSTGYEFVASLAWNPKSGELWVSARDRDSPFGVVEIQAVSSSGKARVVARAPTLLLVEDIAADGTALVRSDDWPTTMRCLPPGVARDVDLSWLDFSKSIDLSRDGRTVVFTEGGAGEGSKGGTYVRKTDGSSPAVRLGDSENARGLSRDGTTVLQVFPDRVVLLPVGAGETRTIHDDGFEYLDAAWLGESGRILIEGRSKGGGLRVYLKDIAGGAPRAITPEGFGLIAVSPDGTRVVAESPDGRWIVAPVAGGDAAPLSAVKPGDWVMGFDASGGSLFVRGWTFPLRIERVDVATGARTLFKEIALDDPTGVERVLSAQITPDGSCYCYSFMRSLSRLYAVEGLR
jgi:Tol biopolymer transport system component